MNCSLPGSSIHGDSPGKNSGVGSHSLPQGIFPNQGSSPGPLQRRILSDRAAREALKKRKKKYSLASINSLVPFPQVSNHPCFSISGKNIGSNYKTQLLIALLLFLTLLYLAMRGKGDGSHSQPPLFSFSPSSLSSARGVYVPNPVPSLFTF